MFQPSGPDHVLINTDCTWLYWVITGSFVFINLNHIASIGMINTGRDQQIFHAPGKFPQKVEVVSKYGKKWRHLKDFMVSGWFVFGSQILFEGK